MVRFPTAMVDEWFGLAILRLILNMQMDPVLALVVMAHFVEVD